MTTPSLPSPRCSNFPPSFPGDSDTLFLRGLFSVVRQRIHVAATIFGLIALATIAYVGTRPPLYTATATLLIEPSDIALADMSGALTVASAQINQRDIVRMQSQLITSTSVLKQVLETGLFADIPEIADAQDPLTHLAKMIQVTPAPANYALDVSVTYEDAAKTADMVNAIAEAFRNEVRNRYVSNNEGNRLELLNKAEELRPRLAEAEDAIKSFLSTNNLGSFEEMKILFDDRCHGINKNLADIEAKRIAAETQYAAAREAVENGSTVESIPDVLESPVVAALRIELAKLKSEEAVLVSVSGNGDSSLEAIRTKISSVQNLFRAETERIVESLLNRREQLQNEESLLRAELAGQKKQATAFAELDSQYRFLCQNRDSLQEFYNSLLRRINEIEMANLTNQGDSVSIIARAQVPDIPAGSSRIKLLAGGLFLAFLLSIGVCFLLDYFDTTVKGDVDVQICVRHPLLGSVPYQSSLGSKRKPADIFHALSHPGSAFAEAFRTVRTCLSFSAAGHPVRSLVVSSAGNNEGKSICAANLAIACAQSAKNVLLVDADLRKGGLSKAMSGTPAGGLSDFLAGDSEFQLSGLVKPTQVPRLSFLSAGTLPPDPVALLESPRLAALLETLFSQYDLVIFDAPPCLDKVDALVLAKQTDGLAFVVRAFASDKFAVQKAVSQIEMANVKPLGTILNAVRVNQGKM